MTRPPRGSKRRATSEPRRKQWGEMLRAAGTLRWSKGSLPRRAPAFKGMFLFLRSSRGMELRAVTASPGKDTTFAILQRPLGAFTASYILEPVQSCETVQQGHKPSKNLHGSHCATQGRRKMVESTSKPNSVLLVQSPSIQNHFQIGSCQVGRVCMSETKTYFAGATALGLSNLEGSYTEIHWQYRTSLAVGTSYHLIWTLCVPCLRT